MISNCNDEGNEGTPFAFVCLVCPFFCRKVRVQICGAATDVRRVTSPKIWDITDPSLGRFKIVAT